MADYIESEAEESDEEEEDLSPEQRKKLKKLKREQDDEEDDEDDEEQLAEEMKDLIDDGEVEEEESDDDSVGGSKRKREDEDDFDDRLEDDDYDLIEENLGVKVQRKKFRRLQQVEDDDSDEEDNEANADAKNGRARDTIANELFEGSEEEGAEKVPRSRVDEEEQYQDLSGEEGEGDYSDTDDFIVDDEGQPLTKSKRKRPRFSDAALQQAQDIFGVEFDFNEFDAYGGEDYEEDVEEDAEEYEEEVTAEGEVPEVRRKPKKVPKKKHTRKSIFEVYEPSELERGHFTDKDNEIRAVDMPERFQLRGIPVTPAEDAELEEEAEWIYKYAFAADAVSCQENDFKVRNSKAAAAVVVTDIFGDKDKASKAAATPTAAASGDEEDWDAESAPAAATPATTVAADTEEDWDAELTTTDTAPASKAPAADKSKPDDTIADDEENWDTEVASPKPVAATPVPMDTTTDGEDWDTEVDGASKTKSAASGKAAVEPAVDRKRINTINKIREALKFMRNQQCEVPFIAFYRKEYVEPELNITDLWRVYHWDEKWCQLRQRKENLIRLLKKMQDYQANEITSRGLDQPLAEDERVFKDEDVDRVHNLQTFEELKDAYYHLILYYGADIPKMQEALIRKRREHRARRVERVMNDEGEVEERELPPTEEDKEEDEEAAALSERVKQASRVDGYTLCRRAGLAGLAKHFGLKPYQFGENLRDNYQRHEVDQYPLEPMEAALEYVSAKFPTADDVMKAVRFMVATQISREPLVRQCVRETFFERAKICVKATKKGSKEIDENHPCFTMKYLKNKPVKELKDDAFLKLSIAEEDKLLTISLGMDMEGKSVGLMSYVDEIRQLYHRDEFSNNVQEWNAQRALVVELALTKFLYPVLQKELRSKLLQESRDFVVKACCRRLYGWLKVAPFSYDNTAEDEDDDYETTKGIRVLAIAYINDRDTAGFGALLEVDGEMSEFIRLPHILTRKDTWNEAQRENKASELNKLKGFISGKKPHVIVVCGESRDATTVIDELKAIVSDLVESEQMPQIEVEMLDNELAKVFQNSNRAETDFRDYPPLLKQAISLGRRMQDPLAEFAQLCSPDEEILCLQYHGLQDQIPREDLMNALFLEFVNRTNEVGVDINRCVARNHASSVAQFICGLGPRKGQALIKTLKQANQRLENRTQLVTVCHMGPKVFINCAGFIKLDTIDLGDSTEAYVEVLDGSRVHPETYEWARKMAVDALEYDDMAEDANPAGALEEILENPEKLKDLDLDAFAEELERQGFGNKSITLYDIRAELNHRYRDLRAPFKSCTPEEKFNMLTKETPETFYVGKMILAKVMGIAHRKPQGDQLDQANPVRNEETGLWQCPFCLKNDFLEVSEVWNHFDAASCPGQATGVKARLDNGIFGFIPTKFISDKHVANPEDRVKAGMTLHCRIMKIDIERFQVDLTCRSSDLADKNNEWRPAKDVYYDNEIEDKESKTDDDVKKRQTRQTYIKRVIVHPSFHNISFKDAEKLLVTMDQGEAIVRPSSKGADHLTITWKVTDDIYQHIDVREEGKENAFSLGQSLWIGSEEFEDLDEIVARHVQPMAAFARDIIAFRYYRETGGANREVMEKLLAEEKKKAPNKIHYLMSASKEIPGKFVMSYLPRTKARHELITATPDGLRYRQHMFHSVNSLIRWFKEHFRDPIPGGTPSSVTGRTPSGPQASTVAATTPSINMANLDPQAIQRAAQSMPRHVYNTLTRVASQTPNAQAAQYSNRYSGYNYHPQTPYTPSQPVSTPMLTPSYHAIATPSHGVHTPRYHTTPQTNWAHPHPAGHQTPSRTPSRSSAPVVQQAQPSRVSASTSAASNTPSAAATDWKKAAEQWAMRHQQKAPGGGGQTPRGATPRASPSIRGHATPALDGPGGDSTPLIDEH